MAAHGGGSAHLDVPHRARPRHGTTTNADGSESPEADRWVKWEPAVDAVLVAMLAIASLVAAWSAYQAHHWNGAQSSNYANATALLTESTRQSTLAMQLTTIDVTTFTNYINALATGNTELTDFYTARFRPDFKPAFNAWIAQDPLTNANAPPSPFAMADYLLPETVLATDLGAQAEAAFAEGEESKHYSEEYVFNTVLLATVLFFAGIAPRVRWMPASIALIALSCVMLTFGIIDAVQLPVA